MKIDNSFIQLISHKDTLNKEQFKIIENDTPLFNSLISDIRKEFTAVFIGLILPTLSEYKKWISLQTVKQEILLGKQKRVVFIVFRIQIIIAIVIAAVL